MENHWKDWNWREDSRRNCHKAVANFRDRLTLFLCFPVSRCESHTAVSLSHVIAFWSQICTVDLHRSFSYLRSLRNFRVTQYNFFLTLIKLLLQNSSKKSRFSYCYSKENEDLVLSQGWVLTAWSETLKITSPIALSVLNVMTQPFLPFYTAALIFQL